MLRIHRAAASTAVLAALSLTACPSPSPTPATPVGTEAVQAPAPATPAVAAEKATTEKAAHASTTPDWRLTLPLKHRAGPYPAALTRFTCSPGDRTVAAFGGTPAAPLRFEASEGDESIRVQWASDTRSPCVPEGSNQLCTKTFRAVGDLSTVSFQESQTCVTTMPLASTLSALTTSDQRAAAATAVRDALNGSCAPSPARALGTIAAPIQIARWSCVANEDAVTRSTLEVWRDPESPNPGALVWAQLTIEGVGTRPDDGVIAGWLLATSSLWRPNTDTTPAGYFLDTLRRAAKAAPVAPKAETLIP